MHFVYFALIDCEIITDVQGRWSSPGYENGRRYPNNYYSCIELGNAETVSSELSNHKKEMKCSPLETAHLLFEKYTMLYQSKTNDPKYDCHLKRKHVLKIFQKF